MPIPFSVLYAVLRNKPPFEHNKFLVGGYESFCSPDELAKRERKPDIRSKHIILYVCCEFKVLFPRFCASQAQKMKFIICRRRHPKQLLYPIGGKTSDTSWTSDRPGEAPAWEVDLP